MSLHELNKEVFFIQFDAPTNVGVACRLFGLKIANWRPITYRIIFYVWSKINTIMFAVWGSLYSILPLLAMDETSSEEYVSADEGIEDKNEAATVWVLVALAESQISK